jgi:hypothetical protein
VVPTPAPLNFGPARKSENAMQIQSHPRKVHPKPTLCLAPDLVVALRELAALEGLPLPTLITALLLEALSARCRRPS